MPNPTFTFGFMIATLYGACFHLIFGGASRRLAMFIGASWLGFGLGHFTGAWFDVRVFTIGAVYFFTATIGAMIALIATHFLTQSPAPRR